jgi:DNA mismatch repair protein MSH4
MMSDKTIRELLDDIRGEIPALYRVCESIALLDMLAALAQIATNYNYTRPELTAHVAIKAGRHPVCEKAKNSTTSHT